MAIHRPWAKFHRVRIAFKEWAVVADALGRGEQILILRKGGIHEGQGGFQVEHGEFLLFPTLFHQQRESVVAHARARFDRLRSLWSEETVLLEYWARVAMWRRLDSLAAAASLRGQHIWREAIIAERFDWGRSRNVFALALRVYRLPAPVMLPMRREYGGCKSWIELAEDVPTAGSRPVLAEDAFERKARQFCASLESAGVAGPQPV